MWQSQTAHIWEDYNFVPDHFIIAGYTIYIIPLVLLWLLSCSWLIQLVRRFADVLNIT